MTKHKTKLILASQSPRRHELLTKILHDINTEDKSFDVFPADLDERAYAKELPLDYSLRIAAAKADAVLDQAIETYLSNRLIVLAADTIVSRNNVVMGKPGSKDEASRILRFLSGTDHQVITAYHIAISSPPHLEPTSYQGYDSTRVTFKKLSEDQIEEYVNTDEPYDKAGAYGIQGQAASFVSSYKGSLDNVIGLPTEILTGLLTKFINS